MTGEIFTMYACSGNKYENNPYTGRFTIETGLLAQSFDIDDFGITNITTFNGETELPSNTKVSNSGDIKRYFYGSGSAVVQGDNGEEYTVVSYPQYDPNPAQSHLGGEPHFNYYVKVIRSRNGTIIDEKMIELPFQIHALPYKKVRTQYLRSGTVFTDWERVAPKKN